MSRPVWFERVRTRLRDALPTIVRRTLTIMPPAGLLLLGLGIVGDVLHWWDDLGYSSNVLASLTAACFGIPVAVFVLNKFIEALGEQRQRMDLLRRLRRTISLIQKTLDRVAGKEAVWAARELSSLTGFFEKHSSRLAPAVDLDDLTMFEETQQNVLEVIRKIRDQTSFAEAFGQDQWDYARARWRFIHDNLILEAESLDMKIMTTDEEVGLSKAFKQPRYPIRDAFVLKNLDFLRISGAVQKDKIARDTSREERDRYESCICSTRSALLDASREFGSLAFVCALLREVVKGIDELEREVRKNRRGNLFLDR